MASPYSTPSHTVIVTPYANEEPMPAGATGTLFLLASGFGIGALAILFAFVFLIGIGGVGHIATSGPTAAQQSAATAPAAPGPAPNPEPNTGGGNGAGNDARTGQSQHAARADPGTEVKLSAVIPGRREATDSESRNAFRMRLWIPGSDLRSAPE